MQATLRRLLLPHYVQTAVCGSSEGYRVVQPTARTRGRDIAPLRSDVGIHQNGLGSREPLRACWEL